MTAPYSDDQIEAGRVLFAAEATFVMGVVKTAQLPPAERPEIAFAGRSNVGKSSLINALTSRKQLARASNTPGRTQEINFFNLAEGRLMLVDLPGYGFAEAPKKKANAWGRVTMDYLKGRPTLKRVFLLIDSRRGVKDIDLDIMKQFDDSAVIYQVVLTKTDKLKAAEVEAVIADTREKIRKRPAAHPVVIATSSETGIGIADVRAEACMLAAPKAAAG